VLVDVIRIATGRVLNMTDRLRTIGTPTTHRFNWFRRNTIDLAQFECFQCHKITGLESSMIVIPEGASYKVVKKRVISLCQECKMKQIIEEGRLVMLYKRCPSCGLVTMAASPESIPASLITSDIKWDEQTAFEWCDRCVNALNTGRRLTPQEVSVR